MLYCVSVKHALQFRYRPGFIALLGPPSGMEKVEHVLVIPTVDAFVVSFRGLVYGALLPFDPLQ